MPVSADKVKALTDRMAALGTSEKDFAESFIRSSGPGGQKVNKSASRVHLVHLPTGLSVKCQRERSQSLNRFLARRLLLDKIEAQVKGFVEEKKKIQEKIRRQKRRRSKKAKEKILAAKRKRSGKKALRGKIVSQE